MKLLTVLMATLGLVACAQEAGDGSEGAASAEPVDLETLMASADPESGKRIFIFCQACHSLNKGGLNKVGPNLHGFYGREAAQGEGFMYSAALTDSGISWDAASLDNWITRPTTAVPGTTMIFAGIKNPKQRADLIAYLQQATAAE
jgi:cytochrome c